MKIIIHSLDELLELTALLRRSEPEVILRDPVKAAQGAALLQEALRKEQGKTFAGLVDDGEPNGLPTDIEPPVNNRGQTYGEAVAATAQLHEAIIGETLDADGVPHNTDWHSEPAKINADGRWKARRGRDNDAYKAWLLEQAVEVAEAAIAADEAEPVATETHALPQDDGNEVAAEPQETGSEPGAAPADPASAVDLEALIAASRETLALHSGAHVDLLNECRIFVDKHGHPAFTALKEAAVQGRSIPQLNEIEDRQLMQACIANYPSN